MVLRFLAEAGEEFAQAVAYYEECELGLGLRFRQEVDNACSSALRDPRLWRERSGGYQRVNLSGFNYYLAYVVRDEILLIICVAHGSRHPNYWMDRLR